MGGLTSAVAGAASNIASSAVGGLAGNAVGTLAGAAVNAGLGLATDAIERRGDRNLLRRQQDLQLRQLQARQEAEEGRADADTTLRLEELNAREAEESRERQTRLRQAQARARARLSASGIEASGGSGGAILEGLLEQSDDDGDFDRQLSGLRRAALDVDLGQVQSQNLLERQQLVDRQAFERSIL